MRAAALIKSEATNYLRNLHSTKLIIDLLTEMTLRASPLDIANDILVLDNASESFLRELRIYLTNAYQQAKRERPFKKIISSDSRHDDGLQLADMIAGAIRQSYLGARFNLLQNVFFKSTRFMLCKIKHP